MREKIYKGEEGTELYRTDNGYEVVDYGNGIKDLRQIIGCKK